MGKKIFTIAAVAIALVFWLFDSWVHYFIYNEPHFEYVPTNVNELWMRLTIVTLIVVFGIFADFFTNRIMHKHKQLEVAYMYGSLIYASRDILDNLLNQMQYFKAEALNSQDFNPEVIKYYDHAIQQAYELVATFSKIERALKDPASVTEPGRINKQDG